VLERGEEVDWFASNWIIIGTVIASGGIIALVIWELRRTEPIIDFRLFKNRLLSVGCAIGSATGFALFGSSFLLPQFTENLLNYPAYQAGLVLMPRAIAMFLVMPIIGRLYNYVSPRLLVGSGVLMLIYGYWLLAHLNLYVGFWSFAPILVLTGLGMGTAMVTLSTVSLSTIARPQMTGASGLNTLTRREAGNIAYALLATVLARRTQFHRAMLVGNVNDLNQGFLQMDRAFSQSLQNYGYNSAAIGGRDLKLINNMINRHATIMAYNDCFYVLVPVLLLSMLLLFLLPKHGYVAESASASH
jgi:DHA2 family multidrug resistance protein